MFFFSCWIIYSFSWSRKFLNQLKGLVLIFIYYQFPFYCILQSNKLSQNQIVSKKKSDILYWSMIVQFVCISSILTAWNVWVVSKINCKQRASISAPFYITIPEFSRSCRTECPFQSSKHSWTNEGKLSPEDAWLKKLRIKEVIGG